MSKLLLNYDSGAKDYTSSFRVDNKEIYYCRKKDLESKDIEKKDIQYRIVSMDYTEETEKGSFVKIYGLLYRIAEYEENEKKDDIRGVILTKEGIYISLPQNGIMPLFLLIPVFLILTGIPIALNILKNPTVTTPENENIVVTKPIGDNPDGDDIILPGITKDTEMNTYRGFNSAKVSQKQTSVPLVNAEENTSYAEYIIYKDGKEIYKSDLVVPGTHAEWNAYKSLKTEGEHKLTLVVNFYEPVVNEKEEITGFIPCDVSIQNDQFMITVVEEK